MRKLDAVGRRDLTGTGESRLKSWVNQGRKITGETFRTPVKDEKKKECSPGFS